MTIQWTLVAAFLYLELAFIFLLILPIIPPKVWQYIFYSRFCKVIADKANVYFTIFIIVLILFFLDSIREMWTYSGVTTTSQNVNVGHELMNHLKLFRSQRNYFISGFAVFLWLVIRRLVVLILCEADLLSENESAMKRAQNATETVEKILKQNQEADKNISLMTQMYVAEAEGLHKAIEEAKNELNSMKKEIEDTKQRSDAVTAEYEVLLEKHATLRSKAVSSDNPSKPEINHEDEIDNDEEGDESDSDEEDISAN